MLYFITHITYSISRISVTSCGESNKTSYSINKGAQGGAIVQNRTFSDCLALRQYIAFPFNLQKINSVIRIPKPHITGGLQRYTGHKLANL